MLAFEFAALCCFLIAFFVAADSSPSLGLILFRAENIAVFAQVPYLRVLFTVMSELAVSILVYVLIRANLSARALSVRLTEAVLSSTLPVWVVAGLKGELDDGGQYIGANPIATSYTCLSVAFAERGRVFWRRGAHARSRGGGHPARTVLRD